jgi:hypothetical protein
MSCKFLFLSVLLLMGVFANVPSCWTPAYVGNTSAYEFISGYNQYNTTAYSVSLVAGDIDAAAIADMGATGMTLVQANQYQDGSLNRGFAALFYDTSHAKYYSVFQYVESDGAPNYIWAIPDLTASVSAGETFYTRGTTTGTTAYDTAGFLDPDAEIIYFYNATAVKVLSFNHTAMSQNYYHYLLKFGADTIDMGLYFSVGGFVNSTVSTEGYVTNLKTTALGGANAGYAFHQETNRRFFDGSSGIAAFQNGDYNVGYIHDYYSCAANTGAVLFTVYEGSEECGPIGNAPAIDCVLNGETIHVNGTYVNETTATVTTPRFKTVTDMGDYYRITPLKQTGTQVSEKSYFDFRKYKDHPRALFMVPTSGTDGVPFTALTVDNQIISVGVFQYLPPNDAIASLNISSINFDTGMELVGGSCVDWGILGHDHYDITTVVGVNTTFFKKTVYSCNAGVSSSAVTYGTTLSTLLDSMSMTYANFLNLYYPDATTPIWINSGNTSTFLGGTADPNAINRFIAAEYTHYPDGWSKTEGDINVADNDAYTLSYTEYNKTIIAVNSSDMAYGTYFYTCAALPAGYVYTSNSSGYVVVDSPSVYKDISVQAVDTINLEINLFQQQSPLQYATCRLGGQIVDSGANGVCTFANVPIDSENYVYVTKGTMRRVGIFPTGDYYGSPDVANSCGYGTGGTCSDFIARGRTYHYNWNLENEYLSVSAVVGTSILNMPYIVRNASLYWDGVKLNTQTDYAGIAIFDVAYDYTPHTLMATHPDYYNTTIQACIDQYPFIISMGYNSNGNAEQDAKEKGLMEGGQDYSGVTDLLFSPFALSLIVIGVVMIASIMLTQSVPIAVICGVLAALGLVAFGALPVWFGIIIIIIAAAGAYVLLGGFLG